MTGGPRLTSGYSPRIEELEPPVKFLAAAAGWLSDFAILAV
jgi:hypothetical protein